MSDLVVRRQRDLALRLALGARAWRLMSQVVGTGLRTALVGTGSGMVAAAILLPVLGQVIIGPSLPSLASVALTGGVIALLAAGASAMPAWRVMRLDPRELLQED
jgi:ABC-type antimicrobial peptide transport system permease subunit